METAIIDRARAEQMALNNALIVRIIIDDIKLTLDRLDLLGNLESCLHLEEANKELMSAMYSMSQILNKSRGY